MENINIGDVVKVVLPQYRKIEDRTFTSKITEINERLGRINSGMTNQNPLVRFENGRTCDGGFITEVIERCKNPVIRKKNIFKGYEKDIKYCKSSNPKVYCAPKLELVKIYLSRLDENIITDISPEKYNKCIKSLTGFKPYYKSIFLIKKKHFEKWFKNNWRKILYSKKEYSDIITKRITKEENEFYDVLLDDLYMD